MKKMLLIILLFVTTYSFSQTISKRYNDLLKRWEFLDENRQLQQYAKYNSLYERWEYFSPNHKMTAYSRYNTLTGENELVYLNSASSRSNSYGEAESLFNAELASKVLANRQREYDNKIENTNKFLQLLAKRSADFANQINDYNVRNDYIEIMYKMSRNYINDNMEYIYVTSNYPILVREFDDMLEKAYKKAVDKNISYNKNTSYKKNTVSPSNNNSNYTQVKEDAIEPKLRKNPHISSPVIYELKGGEKVKILEKAEGVYYRVKIDNHIGYISKGYLEL